MKLLLKMLIKMKDKTANNQIKNQTGKKMNYSVQIHIKNQ